MDQRSIPVNGHVLSSRMLELGISERDLSKRTGMGENMGRAMLERNRLSSSAQIADLKRCLEETGLTFSDLLDVDPAPPPETDSTDVATLADVLVSDRRMHPVELVAIALGWTLDRVETAIEALNSSLRPAGLRVHQNSNGVAIRSYRAVESDPVLKLSEVRDDDKGILKGAARMLFAVYAGTVSQSRISGDANAQLGYLKNRGAVRMERGAGQRRFLSDDCAFSFVVD